MSKGIRIYFGKQRYCFNVGFGMRMLLLYQLSGLKVVGLGTEEGAMVVHLKYDATGGLDVR